MRQELEVLRHIRSRMNHDQVRDYMLKHKPTQVYIRVDMSKLNVTVRGLFKGSTCTITVFYSSPTLAQAVGRAREFCQRYYHDVPTLEYNVQ